jgi:hypothetical protein
MKGIDSSMHAAASARPYETNCALSSHPINLALSNHPKLLDLEHTDGCMKIKPLTYGKDEYRKRYTLIRLAYFYFLRRTLARSVSYVISIPILVHLIFTFEDYYPIYKSDNIINLY